MDDLILAIGLVLIIEGLVYAVLARRLKQFVVILVQLPEERLRFFGLLAAAVGVILVWIVKKG